MKIGWEEENTEVDIKYSFQGNLEYGKAFNQKKKH